MPPPPPTDAPSTYHVLINGFGPFMRVPVNPSWGCTKPLHNTVIQTQSGAKIHITVLGPVCVAYDTVLKLISLIHARPPRLPITPAEAAEIIDPSEPMPSPDNFATPPESGYDFILHVGAGRNGAACLEQIGHKSGYFAPDVRGKYAPIIPQSQVSAKSVSEAESFERERLGSNAKLANGKETRGFGIGYEVFPEELHTEVDVNAVIAGLKDSGEARVQASTDAGHYLCDFTCYGSLAESQRPLFEKTPNSDSIKRSKSLFMHVPTQPDSPFKQEELVELVRQVVAQVCTGEKALQD